MDFTYLVFFRFRLLKLRPTYGIVSGFVLINLIFLPLIGLRFTAPYSADLRVVQHTIQLTPRLTEPTLVTKVLVEPNVPIRKGTPIFMFDDRIYKARARQAQAQLAAARQNVLILQDDLAAATQAVARTTAARTYAEIENRRCEGLAQRGAASDEAAQKAAAQLAEGAAAVAEAVADETRALRSTRRSTASTRRWPRPRLIWRNSSTMSIRPQWWRPKTA